MFPLVTLFLSDVSFICIILLRQLVNFQSSIWNNSQPFSSHTSSPHAFPQFAFFGEILYLSFIVFISSFLCVAFFLTSSACSSNSPILSSSLEFMPSDDFLKNFSDYIFISVFLMSSFFLPSDLVLFQLFCFVISSCFFLKKLHILRTLKDTYFKVIFRWQSYFCLV